MKYELNPDQQILRDTAHSFLSKECPSLLVRQMAADSQGFNPGLWQKMAELGWMALLVPERYGGAGGNFLDLAVLLHEMGYACLPGPFFSTLVLGGLPLLAEGSEEQKNAILPDLAVGKKILTLAWTEKSGTYSFQGIETQAEPRGDYYIMSGTKLFVPDAHVADVLICVARTRISSGGGANGLSLFLVDGKSPGITLERLPSLAGDKQYEVIFDQVRIPQSHLLGQPNQGGPILEKLLLQAAVAKCAEMCGGGQKVIELAIAHVKERVQFDHPVGSFQAVQHHCANILTYLETSRFMTFQAAWRISEGLPCAQEGHMCKAWVSDSYRRLVVLAHQVLGGMGFMEEHDLHLYFRQAKAGELAFGDGDFHRERVAHLLGL